MRSPEDPAIWEDSEYKALKNDLMRSQIEQNKSKIERNKALTKEANLKSQFWERALVSLENSNLVMELRSTNQVTLPFLSHLSMQAQYNFVSNFQKTKACKPLWRRKKVAKICNMVHYNFESNMFPSILVPLMGFEETCFPSLRAGYCWKGWEVKIFSQISKYF